MWFCCIECLWKFITMSLVNDEDVVLNFGFSETFVIVVLSEMGYRLSPHFIQCLLYRYDPLRKQSLTFDAFIQSCVLLKSLTDIFRQKDTQMRGSVQISYEEFMCAVFASTF